MARSAILLLAVLLLSSCAQDYDSLVQRRTHARAVPRDAASQIWWYDSISPDCKPSGRVGLKLISAPAHGTIEFRDGLDFPNFPTSDVRSRCDIAKMPSRQVWYTPAPGFIGTDTLELDIVWPTGSERIDQFVLSVK
jgi:hypothetical protein